MLILTRKPGESVYIGDDIKITIVEIKGHQIRVGVDAPREMRIYREEIYLQILEENKQAAEATKGSDVPGLEGLTEAWGQRKAGGAMKLTSQPTRRSGEGGKLVVQKKTGKDEE